jgi:preprotein translocase subunit SecE
VAEKKPAKTTPRRLRAPSQTVRQQAEQGQANADKPQKTRRLRAAAASTRKPFAGARKALDRQPFKTISKVLRFIGRIIFPKVLRNAFTELRLVTWPSARETRRLTFAVLAFAFVFGVSIATVDYGLDKLFRAIILK